MELTEFETQLEIIISEASHLTSDYGSISTYCQFGDREIKRISTQILNLARKELMKDLPKWKKMPNDESNDLIRMFETRKGTLIQNCKYYISLDDLETLPKEE